MSAKPKSNAVLKNLPEERQAQIAEWCRKANDVSEAGKPIAGTGGLAYAQKQLVADGLSVSLDTLSRWFSWWELEQDMDLSFEVQDQVLARTGNVLAARSAGEEMLLRLGMARKDPKLITAATLAQDSRRSLDLQELSGRTKAEHGAAKIAQKDEELQIARQKFQRDTAKLFLKWADDERAKAIVTGGGTNSEKIEALGQAMFGEDWAS